MTHNLWRIVSQFSIYVCIISMREIKTNRRESKRSMQNDSMSTEYVHQSEYQTLTVPVKTGSIRFWGTRESFHLKVETKINLLNEFIFFNLQIFRHNCFQQNHFPSFGAKTFLHNLWCIKVAVIKFILPK